MRDQFTQDHIQTLRDLVARTAKIREDSWVEVTVKKTTIDGMVTWISPAGEYELTIREAGVLAAEQMGLPISLGELASFCLGDWNDGCAWSENTY